ncbi:MAG: hypothetical protein IJ729_00595 [Alloprevotella sp.]|nr:hypothetical protein [Alloprevotella sp.]
MKANSVRKISTCVLASFLAAQPFLGHAQGVEYQTFIYTSEDLATEINKLSENSGATRSYMGDVFQAAAGSLKGLGAGYIISAVDLGLNAVGALFTANRRHRQEWEEAIKKENVYQTRINTISDVSDFYDRPSFDGAMDPKGMRFNGIGCLRRVDKDTTFYVSCHIDRDYLHRIVNHSKFQLALDTLIISPEHSSLPNTELDIPYRFEDRKDFTLTLKMQITSSWMNEIVQLQKNQELGEFSINIRVPKEQLDERGYLRYVRQEGEPAKYKVVGESFIVPRSYMGFRDENDVYKDSWGTGEYNISIDVKETCDVTEEYRARWKSDRKMRKALVKSAPLAVRTWETIQRQHWDELAQAWIITTLKAPATMVTDDVLSKLKMPVKKDDKSKK